MTEKATKSKSYKVGVLDSGVGGLSILSEIIQQAPDIELHYFADDAFAPYGNLTAKKLQKRTQKICQFFMDMKVDAIVIACNTATVEAIDYIRALPEIVKSELPIIGVEPAIKPASLNTKTGNVTVLATPVTCQSERLGGLMQRHSQTHSMSNSFDQITYNCFESLSLAPDIDRLPATEHEVEREVMRIRGAMVLSNSDTLVLACTHYPLIKNLFEKHLDPKINIIEPSNGVTAQLLKCIDYQPKKSVKASERRLYIYSSGDEDYAKRLPKWVEYLLAQDSTRLPKITLTANSLVD